MTTRPDDPPSLLTPLTPIVFAARWALRLGLGPRVGSTLGRLATPVMLNRRSFGSFQPGDFDIIVATYPKSGTNWLLQMCTQIAWRGQAEFEHIHCIVPWPDAPSDKVVPLSAPIPSPTGHRVIKTHLDARGTPAGGLRIAVIRDPKEVVVSSYFFIGGLLGVLDHIDIDDWCDMFLKDASPVGPWAEHTASWWELRDREDTELLNFADIKKDLPGHIDRVAGWMGVELNRKERAAVIERCGLAWMKAHESQFTPMPLPGAGGIQRPKMIRKGTSGGSGEMLSREQQRAIDAHARARLQDLGCDLPYDEWFDPVS